MTGEKDHEPGAQAVADTSSVPGQQHRDPVGHCIFDDFESDLVKPGNLVTGRSVIGSSPGSCIRKLASIFSPSCRNIPNLSSAVQTNSF
jgi:hypothetical protein